MEPNFKRFGSSNYGITIGMKHLIFSPKMADRMGFPHKRISGLVQHDVFTCPNASTLSMELDPGWFANLVVDLSMNFGLLDWTDL